MESNKAILVVNAVINKENMQELPSYLQQIGPLFAKYGAVPTAKYKAVANVQGEDSPELISIASFDNEEAIHKLTSSEDFNALSELRARVFSKLNMVICAAA
ncbi:MAG: DUF1330 domain-containing protein [Schleiferiaceae bacterium]|jgi:uncharacterized protein (DUF1330 family)|nr:DUF1330 domain-containing protein [Schleiferiaceae bacterium]